MIAETTNASGPNTTPIIANVNGNDNTPPPEMMEFLQHIQKESKRVEPKEDDEDNLSM